MPRPSPRQPQPQRPLRSGAHSGPAVLWPGLPEATLLRRLPPSLPPGPRLLKAPVQGWSTDPSAKRMQNLPPALEATSTFQDQGLAHTPALHLPTAPKEPSHPTSRTEPASFTPACPAAHRTPHLSQAGAPHPGPSCSSRQMPPDQHMAQPTLDTLPPCPTALPWKPLRSVSEKCEPQMYQSILCSLDVTPSCFSRVTDGMRRPLQHKEPGAGLALQAVLGAWLFFPPPSLGLFLGSPTISASRQNRLEEQPRG